MMFNGVRFSFLLSIVLVLTFTSEVFSRSAACKKLRVRSPEQSELKGNRAKPFSSSAILDLQFQVLVPRTSTGRYQIHLYTPNGHLYQKLTTAKTGKQTRRRRNFEWAAATLPVAGTTIVWSSLYGTWRAEVFAEGSEQSCRARRFRIVP